MSVPYSVVPVAPVLPDLNLLGEVRRPPLRREAFHGVALVLPGVRPADGPRRVSGPLKAELSVADDRRLSYALARRAGAHFGPRRPAAAVVSVLSCDAQSPSAEFEPPSPPVPLSKGEREGSSRGFTLVELLVVITIVGMLMSLMQQVVKALGPPAGALGLLRMDRLR